MSSLLGVVAAATVGLVIGSLVATGVERVVTGASGCRASLGIQSVVIGSATAGLFVLMAVRFDDMRAAILAYWVLMAVLVAQTWIDLHTRRLPRKITYWGIGVGAVALAVAAIVLDQPERIWMATLGAGIALITMWLIHRCSNGALGEGDVRFAPLLGLFLGWLNPGIVLPGLFFGYIAGAVVALAMLIGDRAGRQTELPFGPFLALGTVVAIFVGQDFVDLVLAR